MQNLRFQAEQTTPTTAPDSTPQLQGLQPVFQSHHGIASAPRLSSGYFWMEARGGRGDGQARGGGGRGTSFYKQFLQQLSSS